MKRIGFICFSVLIFVFWGCDNSSETKTFTVTFDLDGGNIGGNTDSVQITVTSGGTISDLPSPQKANNGFGGWFTEKNGAGTAFTASTTVSSNLTVCAKWILDSPIELRGRWEGIISPINGAANSRNTSYTFMKNSMTYDSSYVSLTVSDLVFTIINNNLPNKLPNATGFSPEYYDYLPSDYPSGYSITGKIESSFGQYADFYEIGDDFLLAFFLNANNNIFHEYDINYINAYNPSIMLAFFYEKK